MYHRYHNETFDFELWVVVAKDPVIERQRKKWEEMFGKYEDNFYACHCWRNGASGLFLPRDVDVGVVAHEVMHSTDRMLEWNGVDLVEGNEEVYARVNEWITNRVYESFKKWGIKPKVKR